MYNQKNKSFLASQDGFTLIEIAAVIMVSAVFMIAAAQFVKIYTIGQQYDTTLENAEITQAALREFFALEGRYPCPADPTLAPNEAGYGEEDCRNYADPGYDADNCVNVPINIMCFDSTIGSFSRDGNINGVEDVIVQGAVPFRTISEGIVTSEYREYHKKDGYGRLYSYAVTEHMTNSVLHNAARPANPRTGAIRILDENGINMTDPVDSAHYILFSHGDNGRGGYTQMGVQLEDCTVSLLPPPAPPTPPAPGFGGGAHQLDIENCDGTDPIYVQGIRSLADNNNYFDDVLFYASTGLDSIWKNSLAAGTETWLYNTNLENIGIGTDDPSHRLHIVGNIRAEGATLGDQYCINGSDGTVDCLDPDALGGDVSGMRCADDTQVAYAIHENELVCRDINWSPIQGTNCPVGQFLNGFSNLGRIRCCDSDGTNCAISP